MPRYLRREARERIDAQGRVLLPLDEASVRAAAEHFAHERVEAIAVCFLFAFLNPAHEDMAERILTERLPGVPISLSSRVCPEIREYERTSTTVINAYLTPVMAAYLDSLQLRLDETLGPVRLSVIQANGGSASVAAARRRAVTTVNSGPAGGVVAAAYYGRRHARDRIVPVDMGGTSFDIGLVDNGACAITTEGGFQGLPVRVPIIDLHIIGAGGGSIAWRDAGGALQVGPRSAGAEPGPACYGRGGTAATVTDANLVLGRLSPEYFNGGRMRLDVEAAKRAVGALAAEMRMGLEQTALGIVRVVNANMVKGIAAVTILRGIDVREFSLLSFGGAGGLHAVDLAQALSMREAIVPVLPGTFSAIGLLVTDTRLDYVTALGGVRSDQADLAALERAFQAMERQAAAELAEQGFDGGSRTLIRHMDLKVAGQTYELSLPLPRSGPLDAAGLGALLDAFARLYRERYAFFFDGEPIELVNLRVAALGHNAPIELPRHARRCRARAGAEGDPAGVLRLGRLHADGGVRTRPAAPRHGRRRPGADRRADLLDAGAARRARRRSRRPRTRDPDLMTDVVTMQVIRYGLEQVADEMGNTLVRTGRSTIITEIKDISCVVADARGQTVAQAHHNPSLLAGFEIMMRELVAAYPPERLAAGDVIITNDPYRGGQHIMDLYAISPAFHDGRLIGFVGNITHHSDLGCGGGRCGGRHARDLSRRAAAADGQAVQGGARGRGDRRHHRQPDPRSRQDARRHPRAGRVVEGRHRATRPLGPSP